MLAAVAVLPCATLQYVAADPTAVDLLMFPAMTLQPVALSDVETGAKPAARILACCCMQPGPDLSNPHAQSAAIAILASFKLSSLKVAARLHSSKHAAPRVLVQ